MKKYRSCTNPKPQVYFCHEPANVVQQVAYPLGVGEVIGMNHVITKDVEKGSYCCYVRCTTQIVRVGGMPWSKKCTAHQQAQLGLLRQWLIVSQANDLNVSRCAERSRTQSDIKLPRCHHSSLIQLKNSHLFNLSTLQQDSGA